jgi:DNA polymerase
MVVKNGKNILVRPWYGMITENVSQKLARDIFAHQLKKLDDAGHKIILHVHDEVVIEAPAADAERTLADALKIMCTPPDWIPDIPLSADGQISQYYTK